MGYSTTALATLVVIENELLKAELRQLRIRNLAAEERLIANTDGDGLDLVQRSGARHVEMADSRAVRVLAGFVSGQRHQRRAGAVEGHGKGAQPGGGAISNGGVFSSSRRIAAGRLSRTVSFRLPGSARPKLARTRRAVPGRGNEELRRRRHWSGNVG